MSRRRAALLYGGHAGVLLARGIFGTPVPATFLVRALVVVGMILGVVSVVCASPASPGRWRCAPAAVEHARGGG